MTIHRALTESEEYSLERACWLASAYFEKYGCAWGETAGAQPSPQTIRGKFLELLDSALSGGGHWAASGELMAHCEGNEFSFLVQPVVILPAEKLR